MRIQNATATPPLVYRMEHKANAGMRIHDQRRKLNSSLQHWPEYLMWQWHTLKGYIKHLLSRDLHPLFNSIAAREIARAARSDLRDRIALLDVYRMTTMRPDGRRGDGDCLHFFLPGVPDWWTHKLLVQLRHWAARLVRRPS